MRIPEDQIEEIIPGTENDPATWTIDEVEKLYKDIKAGRGQVVPLTIVREIMAIGILNNDALGRHEPPTFEESTGATFGYLRRFPEIGNLAHLSDVVTRKIKEK